MSMLHKFSGKGVIQCHFSIKLFFQVSTAEQCRSSPKSMISCNKKSLYLPQEMSAIYIEFTEYYYPDGKDFPSKSFLFCYYLSISQEVGFFLAVFESYKHEKGNKGPLFFSYHCMQHITLVQHFYISFVHMVFSLTSLQHT